MEDEMETLDLHGIYHEDVEREVVRFVEKCWGKAEEEGKVITGHSEPMRKLVIRILNEYQATAKIGGELGLDKTYIKVIF
jgi:hypothetical protein